MAVNVKKVKYWCAFTSTCLLGWNALSGHAATANFDPATGVANFPVVEVLNGASSEFFSASLGLVNGNELQLISASPIPPAKGQQRNVFDSTTSAVHIPAVALGADEFYVKLKLIPGSDPLRFTVDQIVNNRFEGCPDFSIPGLTEGSCVLSGEIKRDVTLTKNTQWVLNGEVFIGGDNAENVTLTINPGTHIFGQQGNDFILIRRGSKIMSEGTPDNPVVMSGALQQGPGEWGGLELHGNAPVNGCNADVVPCQLPNVAVQTEFFGGDNPNDNSGVIKYTQILFTGFAVRPDEELNCLTFNGVGAGTVVDFVHCHSGADDGVEMFGGTVQMKHIVLTDIDDDNLDWQFGWQGAAQYVLVKQAESFGDNGIEGDNQRVTGALPRSRPTVANVTVIGRPNTETGQAALLRVGTGGHIWNSVFTGSPTCLTIDGEPTFLNAGVPGNLTGELTINNSFVNCPNNFKDGNGATFSVAEWFLSQPGNREAELLLNRFLPAAGSPLKQAGTVQVNNPFFDSVDYAGAFRDEDDDWTQEWTYQGAGL
ncbi:MAG: hypothetical protein RI993_2191 [Pseudomonadota bacterium]|jgi:hypothetical protein